MSRENLIENTSSVVFIEESISEHASRFRCAGSSAVYKSILGNIAFHLVDFLRNELVTQALIGEWLHELFEVLKHYDSAPSKTAQQTWLGFPIMGIASALSIFVKILNHRYSKKNPGQYLAAEDYLFSVFVSSCLFYAADIVIKTGHFGPMPLSWFVAISAVGLPMVGAFFYKLVSPDSSDQFILGLRDLDRFNPPSYRMASKMERRINSVRVARTAVLSLAVLIGVISRDVHGETVTFTLWQLGLLALYCLIAAKIGYELTHHPKFFQGFVALWIKLLEHGALSYNAISGIFLMTVVYECNDKTFCINSNDRELLTYAGFFLALAIGIFSAATTRVRLDEHHEGNIKIIDAIENGKKNSSVVAQKTANAVSRYGTFFWHKLSACCSDSERNDPVVDGVSLSV